MDQQVLQSCSGRNRLSCAPYKTSEQSLETFMFKCLYPAFCVKRPGLAAAE
ncbi:hypothetical protein DPMN_051862 [Dreissena polymorpha]|uniref:Uncharacterized protein n=1 Tax=Dreissena polymorpha TaxID=45954 RepID=A0A9D4CK60_DREPO|nr:hypothetical protein DPMN_051862 [Dreissena polymorpha]